MSFANLKKNRGDAINKLINEADKVNGGEKKSYGDDRIWKPTRDKAGNGYAVIRFLPAPGDAGVPWTRYWDHGFQGPTGRWYIEKSRTTLGENDPVSEMNSELWATNDDDNKAIVRKRKRRLHYVSNILVVNDSANPENNGKVFLYEFGKKIFDKVMEAMQPEFDDETPINPFDFWEGAEFKIKIRKVEGWVNYDRSEFDKPVALYDGDEARLEEIYNKLYTLDEFTDPANYLSYEELDRKLKLVLGDTTGQMKTAPVTEAPSSAPISEAPSVGATEDFKPEDDGEDTQAFFKRLAEED